MNRKLRLLVDLRPAFDGFAGIPQETRLLFRGFCLDNNLSIEGLLQTFDTSLEPGVLSGETFNQQEWATARRFHSMSKVVISLSEETRSKDTTALEAIRSWLKKRICRLRLVYGSINISLGRFDTRHYEDFVWRYIFSKTLSPSDFTLVTSKNYRVCSVSWEDMQDAGLDTLSIGSKPKYPILDTSGHDIFVAQTPYPGRVLPSTHLVIRYHDAIPIFLPHTIRGKRKHEEIHFYSLMSNVESGAWFACVSETSRQQLLTVFPEVENRAVTIHNMVSPQYFAEESSIEEARKVILQRRYFLREAQDDQSKHDDLAGLRCGLATDETHYFGKYCKDDFRYLLVVSTIDPRKNHATCIAAWQAIRRKRDPDLKLVLVGSPGWDDRLLPKDLTSDLKSRDLFLLDGVPANELRLLYRHASATVCASFSEGFDFSGVEAMRSGGVVVASDIAAHREIYENAAEFFNPYCSDSVIHALGRVLYDNNFTQHRLELKRRGDYVSQRYLPENIMPKWKSFLEQVIGSHSLV